MDETRATSYAGDSLQQERAADGVGRLVLSKPREGEVLVCYAWLDLAPTRIEHLRLVLSPDELERAARFVRERDRHRFVAGRGLLREALGDILRTAPGGLAFQYSSQGKPRLAAPEPGNPLHFNLAHSGGLAVFGFASHELGVDVEEVRPVPEADAIAERFFSARETAELRSLSPEQKRIGFYNCWTRKEALIKATGLGLSSPLSQIEVSLLPGQPAQLLGFPGEPDETSHWSLQAFDAAPGYVGAWAARRRGLRVGRCGWIG